MLNQRVAAPFGNVNILKTPKTDRFVESHRQQEAADQKSLETQVSDLDKQLSSQLGNILNPDIPELTQKWQQYKQSKKELLFDKKLQNNPELYAQKQIEVNQKLGDAMQLINDSSKRKQLLSAQLQDYGKNAYKYEDDFYNRYNQSLTTPTSQVRDNPNFDNHVWTGADMDFSKKFKDAAGTATMLKEKRVANGEMVQVTPITGFSDPVTYKTRLDASLSDRKYSVNARKTLQNMSPQEINDINQKYANLSKDRLDNWNLSELPDLEPKNPNDPAEVFNSLMAKKHAIDATFANGKSRPEIDRNVKRRLDMKDFITKTGIRENTFNRHRDRIEAFAKENKNIDDKDAALITLGADVLKNGTPEQKKYLLSNFGTGGNKNIEYVGANVDGIPSVTTKEWSKEKDDTGNDVWVQKEVVNTLDPNDPDIQIKLVNLYNKTKGRNAKLVNRAYNTDKFIAPKTTTPSKGNKRPSLDSFNKSNK